MILAQELGLPPDRITPDDRLDELPEVDSVKLARAVARLEETLGVELDDDELVRHPDRRRPVPRGRPHREAGMTPAAALAA
ncbi:acyl carrier protein [Streptomyces cinereoruber]|nr:acyl carrier protein [Streptomyces cinereoruber]QEV36541.1 acyl carrier protein [Streptomyces cinereoruber]